MMTIPRERPIMLVRKSPMASVYMTCPVTSGSGVPTDMAKSIAVNACRTIRGGRPAVPSASGAAVAGSIGHRTPVRRLGEVTNRTGR